MRIRSIKPEFWRSEDISSITDWGDRLLFVGLWSYVDDNGVGVDRLSLVTTDLFADDVERDSRETFARVSRGLQNLFEAGRIVRYTHENKPFLYITNWGRHQRIDKPNKPRYPLPTSEDATIRESVARVSRDIRESPAPGTGEQGNRGTGESLQDLSEPSVSDVSNPATDPYPAEFEKFWAEYPRKDQKRDALKAWRTASKRCPNDDLIEAAYRYATDPNRVDRFTKLPAGWLRGDMWLDGPLPNRAGTEPGEVSKHDAKVQNYLNLATPNNHHERRAIG